MYDKYARLVFLDLSSFKLHLCDEDFAINEDALILNRMKFSINIEEKDSPLLLSWLIRDFYIL